MSSSSAGAVSFFEYSPCQVQLSLILESIDIYKGEQVLQAVPIVSSL